MIQMVLIWTFFIFGLVNLGHAMEQELPTAKSNFDVIFAGVLSGVNHSYSEDAHNFYIIADSSDEQMVSERLRTALASRSGFQQLYCGKTVEGSTETSCSTGDSIDVKPFSEYCSGGTEGAVKLVHHIFGKKFMSEQAFNESAFLKKEAHYHDGKLYSRHFPVRAKQTLEGFRNGLLSCFVKRDIGDLARAFLSKDFHLKPQDVDIDDFGLAGLIRDSVRVKHLSDKHVCLVIDLERIYDLCFPPTIVRENGTQTVTFAFNKKHLLLYLKQILLDDVLLHYVRVGEEVFAEPCFLKEKMENARVPYLAFVIDRSGSLESSFAQLQQNLKRTISDAWRKDPHAIVSVTFFSTEIEPLGDFVARDQQNLFGLIDEKTASGETKLLLALQTEIGRIKTRQLLSTHDVTLFLFTDGMNYIDGQEVKITESDLQSCLADTSIQGNALTAISLGFGSACDESTLCLICSTTRGQYFPIDKIDEFLRVLSEKVDCSAEKRLCKILLNLREEAIQQAIVPVPQNDFGIARSNVFLDQSMVGTSFAPVDEKIVEVAPKDVNRVRLSRAFFAAGQLITNTDAPLTTLTDNLIGCDGNTEVVIKKYIEIVSNARSGLLERKKAFEQLQALQGVYMVF